ncbi:hypothetical protein JXR93_00600 [bacterium]|nr:hypothetical protein [bacterium]
MEDAIKFQLKKEQLPAILEKIKEIKESLDGLKELTKDDKKSLNKVGDSAIAFVSKAAEIVTHDDSFLPRSFDVDSFKVNIETFTTLGEILKQYEILQQKIVDTHLILADICYRKALDIYKYAKIDGSNGKHKVIIASMSKHFNKPVKKKSEEKEVVKEIVEK